LKKCYGTLVQFELSDVGKIYFVVWDFISLGIGCMAQECEVLAPEDFVLTLLSRPSTRDKYQQFAFRDYVKSHPQLRFCPGPNCQVIIRAKEPWAKRAICSVCKTVFW
jgi:ariadne-2